MRCFYDGQAHCNCSGRQSPQDSGAVLGTPQDLICSAEVNSAYAKVLPEAKPLNAPEAR